MTKQAELKKQAYESNLKSRALSVIIYLIDRSNQDLTCFPSIPTMAKQLHISVSTVKRALQELIEKGYVEKEARFRDNNGQSSNLYTLLFWHERDELIVLEEDSNCDISDSEDMTDPGCSSGDLAVDNISTDTVIEEIHSISFGDIIAENNKKLNLNQNLRQSNRCKSMWVQDNMYGLAKFIIDCRQKPYHWTGEEVILLPP